MFGYNRFLKALCASTIFVSAGFVSAGLANAAPVQTISGANPVVNSGATLNSQYAVFYTKATYIHGSYRLCSLG